MSALTRLSIATSGFRGGKSSGVAGDTLYTDVAFIDVIDSAEALSISDEAVAVEVDAEAISADSGANVVAIQIDQEAESVEQ